MNPRDRFRARLMFSAVLTKQIYQLITKIETIRAQWQAGVKLSPQTISQLQTSVIVTSTGASNRIEGNKLTDVEIKTLYQKRNITNLKTRDEQEVAGYLEVIQQIFESWEGMSLSENMVLYLHKELLKYSEKDARHRGSYKFTSNRVEARDETGKVVGVIFDPTPQFLVPKEMQELVEWTIEELKVDEFPPLLVIASFIFEFLAIHPFQDGNGRTSRVLTNLMLLQHGYDFARVASHEQIIEENKADYYAALNQTQQTWKTDDEDLCPWVLFFLRVVLLQGERSLKLAEKQSNNLEWELSVKQQTVWDWIQLQSKEFTKTMVIEGTGINIRTVEETIKKLIKIGKVQRLGQGRGVRYRNI